MPLPTVRFRWLSSSISSKAIRLKDGPELPALTIPVRKAIDLLVARRERHEISGDAPFPAAALDDPLFMTRLVDVAMAATDSGVLGRKPQKAIDALKRKGEKQNPKTILVVDRGWNVRLDKRDLLNLMILGELDAALQAFTDDHLNDAFQHYTHACMLLGGWTAAISMNVETDEFLSLHQGLLRERLSIKGVGARVRNSIARRNFAKSLTMPVLENETTARNYKRTAHYLRNKTFETYKIQAKQALDAAPKSKEREPLGETTYELIVKELLNEFPDRFHPKLKS